MVDKSALLDLHRRTPADPATVVVVHRQAVALAPAPRTAPQGRAYQVPRTKELSFKKYLVLVSVTVHIIGVMLLLFTM